MKKLILLSLVLGFSILSTNQVLGQDKPQLEALLQNEAEDEATPLILQFEPRFIEEEAARKRDIAHKRAVIDSLDLSAARRLKLMRDLYRGEPTKRLKKVQLTDTRFEEDPD